MYNAWLSISDLWAVVCCENFCEAAEIEWQDSASIQHIVDVNILGTIRTVKTFIPNLRESKGRIVIASSVIGMPSLLVLFPAWIASVLAILLLTAT